MKKLLLLALFIVGCENSTEPEDCAGISGGNSVEDIDGNCYETIQIGDQLWMAENMKVTHYNNGDEITNDDWGSSVEGQYGVYDNDPANADIYGNLYNWAVVDDDRGVCPEGFHVPSDDEYTVLTDYLGGESVAGGKMKEVGLDHWNGYAGGSVTEEATNESGFTGLPAGDRNWGNGIYGSIGKYGYFWTSSEDNSSTYAYFRNLYFNASIVNRSYQHKAIGFSIRCVKD